MNKLEEMFQTVIGESDLHIPPWISEHPEIDYPIEEEQVVKSCAAITKEVAIGFLNWYKVEYVYPCRHHLRCDTMDSLPMMDGRCANCGGYKITDSQLFEMYLNTLKNDGMDKCK